jgi:hypothetical protein
LGFFSGIGFMLYSEYFTSHFFKPVKIIINIINNEKIITLYIPF